MAGLLDMYFPAEDPMNPANLMPQGLLGPSVLSRMQQADAAQRGRWQAGERGPTPLTEDNMWLADDVAGGLLGPMAMAGIFAGVGAKTANKAALETAQRMASEGADPRAIWRDTGWFQGPEGKWRWEIDDSGATIPRMPNELQMKRRGQISKTFRHDELYRAYPETADIGYIPDYASGRARGTFNHDTNTIGINPSNVIGIKDKDKMRSVTLHELQHAVQGSEDFERGGNVFMAAELLRTQADEQLQGIYDQMGQTLKSSPQMRSLFEQRNSARAMKDWGVVDAIEAEMLKSPEGARILDLDFERASIAARDFSGEPARDAYERLAGEAEARAVQRRMDMTPEQRRETFPLDSYDVPLDELIVRRP